VTLDRQANVRVMDTSNYNSYRSGKRHRYFGGRALKSPIRIPLPHGGRWHVTIDLGGTGGSVHASVSIDHAGVLG